MWKKKKEWVTSVSQIYFVTPSQWLAELVQSSYLKGYPVTVINNGIDLGIFKPTSSDFKTRYKCEGKHILLGVSFYWGKRKGLDVLIELSKRLGSDYQIVLVGTNDKIDSLLPDNIISIHSTQNQGELAEIYSAADIFLNPTREENYPTVNMEAIACGTPVITFNTGGSSEILDENCGAVVPCDDIDSMEREIYRMIQQPYETDKILKKAKEFDAKDRYNEYVRLYRKIAGGG